MTEPQYQHEVDRVISSLALGAFSGIDQLDRLEMVQKLRESGALTEDQVAVVTSQILDPR